MGEDRPYRNEQYLRKQYLEDGKTPPEIARECGVSKTTIYKYMDKFGIERGPPEDIKSKYQSEDWIREQYLDLEKSTGEISEELGISRDTLIYWMDKYDIERRDAAEMTAKRNKKIAEGTKYRDEEWLRKKYIEEGKSMAEIAELVDRARNAVFRALHLFDIPTRDKKNTGADNGRWKGGISPPDYYGSNWDEQREKAIKRDGSECRVCGINREEHMEKYGRDIEVHHIVPIVEFESKESANQLNNLVTLCSGHHNTWEGIPVVPPKN